MIQTVRVSDHTEERMQSTTSSSSSSISSVSVASSAEEHDGIDEGGAEHDRMRLVCSMTSFPE